MKRASLLLAACLLGSMPAATSGQVATSTATTEPGVKFGSGTIVINHNPHVIVQSGRAVLVGPYVSGVIQGNAGNSDVEIRKFKKALEDLQK